MKHEGVCSGIRPMTARQFKSLCLATVLMLVSHGLAANTGLRVSLRSASVESCSIWKVPTGALIIDFCLNLIKSFYYFVT